MSKGISIVICCYNSVPRIRPTLEHIAKQQTSISFPWEVILVDNNSKDGTSNIAQQIWKQQQRADVDFRVIFEEKPGLIHARKTGIAAAKYEYLLFCDDDNWIAYDYLKVAYDIMSANNRIAICGGCGEGTFDTQKPVWFDMYQRAFAVGPQYEKEGIITERFVLYGACSVFRKSVLEYIREIGHESLLIGRKGSQLSGGEDYEYSLLVTMLGYQLWYSPRLRFKHYMPEQRMNRDYLKRLIFGSAKGYASLLLYRLVINGTYSDIRSNWWYQYMKALFRWGYYTLFPCKIGMDRDVLTERFKGVVASLWDIRPIFNSRLHDIVQLKEKYERFESSALSSSKEAK